MEFLSDDKFDSVWQRVVSETKCWSLSSREGSELGKSATNEAMGSSFFALVHPSPDTRPVLWYFHLISNAFNKKHSIVYLLSNDKETKNTMMVLQRLVKTALSFVDIEGCFADGSSSTTRLQLVARVKPTETPKTGILKYDYRFFQEISETKLFEFYSHLEKVVPLDNRDQHEYKRENLGVFALLPYVIFGQILKFLGQTSLCNMAVTSKEVKLYVEEEWVWRRLCKKGFGGNVIFAGTWKRTCLHKSRAIWDESLETVETQSENRKLGDLLLPSLVRKQFWKVATNFRKNGRTTPVSDDLKEIEWYLDETIKHRVADMGAQSEGTRTWKWVFFCGELPKDTWCPTLLPTFKQTGMDHILAKFRREWVRAAFDPQEDLNIPEGVCHIDKIDASELSVEQFKKEYEGGSLPMIIKNGINHWSAMKWTKETFLEKFKDRKLRVANGMKMPLENYFDYMPQQHEDQPLYLFDDDVFDCVIPELLQDWEVPPYFQEDFFEWLPTARRPPYRWLVIGPPRTGAGFHLDPWGTSAWNALTEGKKRWTFYPPGMKPPGVTSNYVAPKAVRWFMEYKPHIAESMKPIECIQEPGEVIFVPAGWWHQVLNLTDTFCVTQNSVNRYNIHSMAREAFDKPRDWTPDFKERLKAEHPELFEDGTLENRFAGIERE